MSIYVQSNQIISELRCHRNLLTSSKTVPLCLKQVLVVRTSLIQISDTRTSFLTILRFLCVIFFIICHNFNPSVWHTQRMTNFVTIFLCRFFAPVWHSLTAMPHGSEKSPAMPHGSEKSAEKNRNEIRHSLCMPHGRVKIVTNYEESDT